MIVMFDSQEDALAYSESMRDIEWWEEPWWSLDFTLCYTTNYRIDRGWYVRVE